MAQGCIYFDIHEWVNDAKRPHWKSVLDKPFRDTLIGAKRRFEAHQSKTSKRLVEVKCLAQVNMP